MGVLVGVGDVVGVDAEQVEVAGGRVVVAVSGGGDVVDAAVGVVALDPASAVFDAVQQATRTTSIRE